MTDKNKNISNAQIDIVVNDPGYIQKSIKGLSSRDEGQPKAKLIC